MPNRKQDNVTQLNQGVNYMDQGATPVQQPGMPMQPQMAQQPMMPQQPVAPAQQPIVNTDALKAQAGNLANNAKNGVNTFVEKVKTDKGVMIGAIVGAVLVVLLVVMVGSKLLNPSYNVVNKYMSALKKGNAEKIAKLYHEEYIEARYDGEIKDFIDALEDDLEELEEADTEITGYKIRECKKYSEDELEDLAESLETLYDIKEKDVKAARKYFVRIDAKVDDEKDMTYSAITVVKIGSKWYMYYGFI